MFIDFPLCPEPPALSAKLGSSFLLHTHARPQSFRPRVFGSGAAFRSVKRAGLTVGQFGAEVGDDVIVLGK